MDFFIGTPLILILFVIYYGLPQSGIHLSSFTVAVTGFTLNVGAYNAAYMTTAYNALNKYETEAAVVQGFNKRQVFLWIILPQVLLSSIPALTNQVINNLKDSSIVFLFKIQNFSHEFRKLLQLTLNSSMLTFLPPSCILLALPLLSV